MCAQSQDNAEFHAYELYRWTLTLFYVPRAILAVHFDVPSSDHSVIIIILSFSGRHLVLKPKSNRAAQAFFVTIIVIIDICHPHSPTPFPRRPPNMRRLRPPHLLSLIFVLVLVQSVGPKRRTRAWAPWDKISRQMFEVRCLWEARGIGQRISVGTAAGFRTRGKRRRGRARERGSGPGNGPAGSEAEM